MDTRLIAPSEVPVRGAPTLMSGYGRFIMWVAITVLIGGVFLGVFARIDALGDRPLAEDEYYFVKSVQSILENGIPDFPTGGYYKRGLPIQYLTAASILTFGETEFAYRFPVLVFSFASIFLVFVYSRRHLDWFMALSLVLVLLLSSWHVEFSRFARMYMAFQCTTLIFLIVVDQVYFQDKWHLRYLPHVIAFVGVLTHSLGIFLTPLLFIPLISGSFRGRFPTSGHRAGFIFWSLLTTLICLIFVKFDFRNFGVVNRFPEGFTPLDVPTFRFPAFPFWSFSSDPLINFLVVFGTVSVVVIGLMALKLRGWPITTIDGVLALLIVFAFFHQFLLCFILLFFLILRHETYRYHFKSRQFMISLGIALTLILAWIAYALKSKAWITRVDGGEFGLIWSLRRTFFGWPDLYTPFYLQWSQELSLVLTFLVIAVVYQVCVNLKKISWDFLRNPAFLIIFVCLCFGILNSKHTSTRYMFFIYPLILLVISLSVSESVRGLAKKIGYNRKFLVSAVSAFIFVGGFALTEDFNPRHLLNIGSENVTFRLKGYQKFRDLWYPRYDFRSPALFLNQKVKPEKGTQIIFVGVTPVTHYFKGHNYAVYSPRKELIDSREKGTVELWTNMPMITGHEELRRYTRDAKTLWLVRRTDRRVPLFQVEEVWADRILFQSRENISLDGRIEVVQIRLT